MHKNDDLKTNEFCCTLYPPLWNDTIYLSQFHFDECWMYKCGWKDRKLALAETIIVGDTLFACVPCQNEVIAATHLLFCIIKTIYTFRVKRDNEINEKKKRNEMNEFRRFTVTKTITICHGPLISSTNKITSTQSIKWNGKIMQNWTGDR